VTPVRLVHARSAAEAAALLRAHAPHAQPIAFGADLLGLWKDGVRERAGEAPVWINLASAPELARIERLADGGWRLGAMATLVQLRRTPGIAPMLADAVAHIASPQLRARSTLGGNLLQRPRCWYFRHPDIGCFKKRGRGCPAPGGPLQAHPGAIDGGPCHAAHPSDLATVLLALDARVEIAGVQRTRALALADLYRGAARRREREAQLAPDEVLAAVQVPPQPATQAFEKLAARPANEFAAAAAAVLLQAAGGRLTGSRVALGGIAAEPLLLDGSGTLTPGSALVSLDPATLARELVRAVRGLTGVPERAMLCEVALQRALTRALHAAR
jgi:xanthine dehydrogenase YagS FAD-binding subunit